MLNDKRVCQILLVPYILWKVSSDSNEQRARRINGFAIGIGQELVPEAKRLFKLAKRVFRVIDLILKEISTDGDMFSGYKAVLLAYYLTQQIFDSKDGKHLPDYEQKALKRINALMSYVLYLEFLDRFHRFKEDSDFLKFRNSAEKASRKIFDKYFYSI